MYTARTTNPTQQAANDLYAAGTIETVSERIKKGYVPLVAGGEYAVAVGDAEYTVRHRAEPKRLTCSCPGSKRGERCEHVRAVERLLMDRKHELVRADPADL